VDDQGVIGDLWLHRPPGTWFNDAEVHLVKQVASQCAIALRQARLYGSAQVQVQELERLNRLKDDFLSTVSHELRTPIANIRMAIQMLELCLGSAGLLADEASRIPRYLTVLQDECHREMQLINDLLDLCRLDAGTEMLQLATIDLNLWIRHIAEPFEARTEQQQQQLQFDISPYLPPLTTDIGFLERIIEELLGNACKYTPAGEKLLISARPDAAKIQIQICNTGVMIPPEECDRIFDKFYRIPSSDPWKYGGTGLGLALVKKLVTILQGSIQASSHDHITCFTIRLPQDFEIDPAASSFN
jgi:signal transduction histidine kinase